MATKTISIDVDVYERLVKLKRERESFSEVLRRELPIRPLRTSGELVQMIEKGTYPVLGLTPEGIRNIEEIDQIFEPERNAE